MNTAPYFSPSELFYRGELTREEARKLVLENARKARDFTRSPDLNRLLKIFAAVALPFVIVANWLASRRH